MPGDGAATRGFQLSDKLREEFRRMLQNSCDNGTITRTEMVELLAQLDAAQATVRSTKYMLWSVIVAAIAAVASAISAAFSAYAVWPKK